MNRYIKSLSLSPPTPDGWEKAEAALAPLGKVLEFSAKQLITSLQEDFTNVYFIKSGSTSHIISDESSEKLLYQLTPGWIFGNLWPGDPSDEDISVSARERTTVYRIPRKDYLSLLTSNADFTKYVMSAMGALHGYLAAEVGNLSFNSCKMRLMRIYCSQVDTDKATEDGKWYVLENKLTHNELASSVGSARVTISKLINELCDDGFLRIINRRAQVSAKGYDEFLAANYND